MKKPNTTTGPWTPDTGKFAYGDFPVVMAPGSTMVCAMSSPFEEGKANARLIAAAPELLEALRNAVVLVHHMAHQQRTTEVDVAQAAACLPQIREAITKATSPQ